MNLILFCVLAYIALQLLVVFALARRPKNEEDYLLAGRSLGPWLGTFAVFATWFGAETCIGAAGEAYRDGIEGVLADPFGYSIGIIAMGLLLAAPLWKRGIVTLADLFEQRYGVGTERLAAIIMIPTSVLWAAAQVRAFGQVLASCSEMGVFAAITLAAVVVIAYTAIGGMWADAVTDLMQGIVLILGVLVIGVVFLSLGGASHLAALPAAKLELASDHSRWALLEAFAVPIFSTMAAQELTSRTLAMRSASLSRSATIGAGFLYLAVGLIPVMLGLTAAAFIGPDVDPERVLPAFAEKYLSTPFYILFLGALVSAILSTLSGALLVAGSLAAHNVIMPLKPSLPDAVKLRLDRGAVIVFGVVAYAIALSSESVYGLVKEASSLGSAGVLVIMLFALWAPRIGSARSAQAALLASVAVYLAGAHWLQWPYPYLASLAAALAAYLLAAFSVSMRPAQSAA